VTAGGKHVYVDHSDPKSVKELLEQICTENEGQLDILVNNSYAAANFILGNTAKKFWEVEANPALCL
uniref:Dehydrogenase/reductase SDR family member 12 n=1 Tax=Bursaphelenchus xylophilus TaxID=6326 RepID=A0A1I7SG24_BURXY